MQFIAQKELTTAQGHALVQALTLELSAMLAAQERKTDSLTAQHKKLAIRHHVIMQE